jgi:hypothetical protein
MIYSTLRIWGAKKELVKFITTNQSATPFLNKPLIQHYQKRGNNQNLSNVLITFDGIF